MVTEYLSENEIFGSTYESYDSDMEETIHKIRGKVPVKLKRFVLRIDENKHVLIVFNIKLLKLITIRIAPEVF